MLNAGISNISEWREIERVWAECNAPAGMLWGIYKDSSGNNKPCYSPHINDLTAKTMNSALNIMKYYLCQNGWNQGITAVSINNIVLERHFYTDTMKEMVQGMGHFYNMLFEKNPNCLEKNRFADFQKVPFEISLNFQGGDVKNFDDFLEFIWILHQKGIGQGFFDKEGGGFLSKKMAAQILGLLEDMWFTIFCNSIEGLVKNSNRDIRDAIYEVPNSINGKKYSLFVTKDKKDNTFSVSCGNDPIEEYGFLVENRK